MVSSWTKPASTPSRGGSHMTRASSPETDCRSAEHLRGESWEVDVLCLSSCVSFVSQDVPYPVEAVTLAGGYVVHQVTAGDSLKTGDQVQLHLDKVCSDFLTGFICIMRTFCRTW